MESNINTIAASLCKADLIVKPPNILTIVQDTGEPGKVTGNPVITNEKKLVIIIICCMRWLRVILLKRRSWLAVFFISGVLLYAKAGGLSNGHASQE
jgi:hypothetical protein